MTKMFNIKKLIAVASIVFLFTLIHTGDAQASLLCDSCCGTPTQSSCLSVNSCGSNYCSLNSVNGICGIAQHTYSSTETFPTGSYCTSGTVSPSLPVDPQPGNTTLWQCLGQNGGTNANCTATRASGTVTTGNPTDPITTGNVETLYNPLGGVTTLDSFVTKIVTIFTGIAYIVAAFFLILSGFRFVTAQGDPKKLETAKHTFYYTMIGIVVIVASNIIINVLKDTLTKIIGS